MRHDARGEECRDSIPLELRKRWPSEVSAARVRRYQLNDRPYAHI